MTVLVTGEACSIGTHLVLDLCAHFEDSYLCLM